MSSPQTAKLTNKDIICFAGEDWWFHNPHSNLHMMKSFAKTNRVLFVNSTGVKMPDLKDRFFFKRVLNKLRSFLRYFLEAEKNIYVLTPLACPLIPGIESIIQKINQLFTGIQIRIIIQYLGFKNPILWVTSPVACDIALSLKKSKNLFLIYYCVDNLSKFPGVNQKYIGNLEKRIQEQADLSFFVNNDLLEERRPFNRRPTLLTHGVDYDHFAQSHHGRLEIPEDIRKIPHPIIGYVGEIKPLDFNLVDYLAQANPKMSFVFIGEIYAEIKSLHLPNNVYFLGKKTYKELPNYMQSFSCNCLYYDLKDPFNLYRNPKKLMEYFACGKPIVSVDIPQVRIFNDFINIAHSYEEFSKILKNQTMNPDLEQCSTMMTLASEHSWDSIAIKAGNQIAELMHEK